jgi:hypothetical protein
MTLLTPWTIHEAEVGLYPAWRDGMPFTGPGAGRGVPAPVFIAKAGLIIAETRRKSAPSAHNWSGAEPNIDAEYEISIAFPDGAFSDSLSRVPSRIATGGFHILVVRFIDARTGHWSCLRFFYVTIEADDANASGEVMARSMRLKSTWLQESTGSSAPPSMAPLVFGEVDWICSTQRITCLTYDPVAEVWSSLPRNETGDDETRYVNFAPVEGSECDVALSAYFPRVFEGTQSAPALPQASVVWSNIILARLGSQDSAYHHGLALSKGISLQAIGIPEPLLVYPQARMLDEPVIVFRFLRRVYATLGHGVLAVPGLTCNAAASPFTHDCPFRLAIPGDPNPTTNQSGLTLYPDGAWLDGTLMDF